MSLISVKNLTFGYDGSAENIFENATFNIDTDWKLGFVGRNGRGKTTFLKLLMGEYEYGGSITADVDFEYFPYDVPDENDLTIYVAQAVDADAPDWQLMRELNLLDVDCEVLYRPFCTLSNGERTKVLLAAMFLRENSFLLIDEPTNHLDASARQKVAEYLKSKKGFILVSHDRAFLDSCTDHIISINRADIEVCRGNFSTWYENRQLKDNYERQRNDELKSEIKRLESAAREKSAWADRTEATKIGTHRADRGFVGHKSAKMMKRSKAIERRTLEKAQEKRGLLKNVESSDELKIHPLETSGGTVVKLKDISILYGEHTACSGVTLEINGGEAVSLCGKNGCGKSSVLKLTAGEGIAFSGERYMKSGLKISYVGQDASALCGELSSYAQSYNIDVTLFKTILRKLGFSREQFEKPIETYSAGQKKKVMIARSLCESAHLYIWDEPLNYIDILSRIQIEALLKKYKPTMLLVEHDELFCKNIGAKSIKMQ